LCIYTIRQLGQLSCRGKAGLVSFYYFFCLGWEIPEAFGERAFGKEKAARLLKRRGWMDVVELVESRYILILGGPIRVVTIRHPRGDEDEAT